MNKAALLNSCLLPTVQRSLNFGYNEISMPYNMFLGKFSVSCFQVLHIQLVKRVLRT